MRGKQYFNIAFTSLDGTIYSGELAQKIFGSMGFKFENEFAFGTAPKSDPPVLIHRSKITLTEAVRLMLKNSNNFIANQLLLVMAYQQYGEGVSFEMGIELLNRFLMDEVGIDPAENVIVEGSGLSKKNRMKLTSVLKILEYFAPNKGLLSELSVSRYKSLRKIGKKYRIFGKSGTLRGISNVSGYLREKKRRWKPIIIMINNGDEKRSRVLEMICEAFG
jgi:D-alanyl-D-alanine carboxypeptidase/D-alanyl-D-alanine-endopeptidase (penicillin-binding protein 4)